jgi:hypothetical protein
MSRPVSDSKTTRFEAPISRHGADDDACRAVEQAEVTRLARADQIRLVEALINPARANEAFARAARRHAKMIERLSYSE